MILNGQHIMAATRAANSLVCAALPYRFARQVNRLSQWLNAESQSITNTQISLVEKYHGAIQEGGSITFDDPEMQKLFIAEADRQFQEDIDYDPPVCDLRGGCDELTISAAEISALEGLVLFD